jgi:drug/metabolite transporter (DMT)-like permease
MMKWVAAAIILRQAYYLTLSRAYRFHDFSLAYPIMRGLNPVLVTGLGVAFLGDRIGLYGGIGIALIAAGIVVSASSRSGAELHLRMPLLLVCLAASVEVSLFLFVDGIGVRATMHSSPGSYAATMAILDGAVSGAIILWSRTSQNMGFTKREVQQSVAGGLLASFAFWIGIWAISVAPIGMVSALRETSILFALLLSVIFLKERLSFGRLLGAATILAGIVLIRVGA